LTAPQSGERAPGQPDPGAERDDALPLRRVARGKVRDVFEVDSRTLLLVASDRVSAYDVVMAEAVPCKGAVLTQLTAWWLARLETIVPHHMITADPDEIVARVPTLQPSRTRLAGRAMLVRRATVVPFECVVRGYLAGSGWAEYRDRGTLAGEPLPSGLAEGSALPEPRFTPATKAASGHDENVTRAAMRDALGPVASVLEPLALRLYAQGHRIAAAAGLVLADTKFEFGERDGSIILIDEVMTPDSSRLWALDSYAAGRTPPSFDKQPLRDYLQGERRRGAWNGEAPPPPLPADVVSATSARYREAFRRLTGSALTVGCPG